VNRWVDSVLSEIDAALASVATVAAIVPTVPERHDLLAEALASVDAQVRPVTERSVVTDHDRVGPAATRNRAVEACSSEWLAFLDDDDVWYPDHVATLLAHTGGADVVYSDCAVTGAAGDLVVNRDFDPFALLRHNYIPVTALVRRSVFLDAGMFDTSARFEDWELWKALSRAGAKFVHVPAVTWEYRFHRRDQRTFKES
jgi:glycosyltransferase involved in cell wall biosynthesis